MLKITNLDATAILLILTSGTAAQGRNLTVSAPMMPFAYGYAACVLDRSKHSAQTQISLCKAERQKLEVTGIDVLTKFHRGAMTRIRVAFPLLFDSVEAQAMQIEADRKYVNPSIIRYMGCLSEVVLASDQFVSGAVIDYRRAHARCAPKTQPTEDVGLTRSGRRRAYTYYQNVYLGGYVIVDDERHDSILSYSNNMVAPYRIREGILGDLSRLPGENVPDRGAE